MVIIPPTIETIQPVINRSVIIVSNPKIGTFSYLEWTNGIITRDQQPNGPNQMSGNSENWQEIEKQLKTASQEASKLPGNQFYEMYRAYLKNPLDSRFINNSLLVLFTQMKRAAEMEVYIKLRDKK
jgi:hypothetical protein